MAELRLDRRKVATIASWDKIALAVEHEKGASFVNASIEPLDDGTFDPEVQSINEAQAKDVPPWEDARFDRYTWAHSMHYLQKHRPRFLFISLDDSDEWGHKGEWKRYVSTLRQYDEWIRELIETLKGMGEYGARTTLLVTTDHGRGDGGSWTDHGWFWPESRFVWLYARAASGLGRHGSPFVEDSYTHSDIRPTIEAGLGLAPHTCDGCGRVIREAMRSKPKF